MKKLLKAPVFPREFISQQYNVLVHVEDLFRLLFLWDNTVCACCARMDIINSASDEFQAGVLNEAARVELFT